MKPFTMSSTALTSSGFILGGRKSQAQPLGGDVLPSGPHRSPARCEARVQKMGGGMQLGRLSVVSPAALKAMLRAGVALLLVLAEALGKARLVHRQALFRAISVVISMGKP
jgi:hypothetical protein